MPLNLIPSNPAKDIILPNLKTPESNRYIVSVKDFKRILERFPFGNNFYIPLLIGYMTGLRISEAFCLEWEDIDFDKKELRVSKSVYKRFKDMTHQKSSLGWYIGTPKTENSIRTVWLDDFTIQELKKEKIRQTENKLYYGEYYTKIYKKEELDEVGNTIYKIVESEQELDLEKFNLISVRENGQYSNTDSFKYCSRIINHDLKIKFNYHSLRHTHTTMLFENGANPIDIQHRLGHSKVDTSYNDYSHVTDVMKKQSVDIISNVVDL